MNKNIDFLEVILKITERCNINCTYCYYFNGSNNDYKSKPVYLDNETATSVVNFLEKAVLEYNIKILQIDFHGGEPLLIKKNQFIFILELITRKLSHITSLRLALQTNGILIDDLFIDIFSKYMISVSVSIDGCKDDNDSQRVDHRGHGTYSQAVAGIKKLQAARELRRIQPGGIICVANEHYDGAKTYRHFVNEIGIDRIHFILPDYTLDNCTSEKVKGIKKFMLDALNEWLIDGPKKIHVRIFNMALRKLISSQNLKNIVSLHYSSLTIRSDGVLNPPDDLRNVIQNQFNNNRNTFNSSLADYINDIKISRLDHDLNELPDGCKQCDFKGICQGGAVFGQPENRYSLTRKFNNINLYCSIYTAIYLKLIHFLISKGHSWENIKKRIIENNSTLNHQ